MQNLQKKSLLLMVMISINNPLYTNWYENPGDNWRAIAGFTALAGALSGGGIVALIFRTNHKAEELKQERFLQAEQAKRDEEKNKDNARRFLYAVNQRYEAEFKSIKESGTISKEVLEKASLQFAGQTPFHHVTYSTYLSSALEQLYTLNSVFSHEERIKAEKITAKIKMLKESHSLFFKDELAVELERRQEGLQQEMLFKLTQANKEEKLKAKQIKTKVFEDASQSVYLAQSSISSTARAAERTLQEFENQARSIYAMYIAEKTALLEALRAEFNQHGWASLANNTKKNTQVLGNLKDAVMADQKIDNETKVKMTNDLEALLALATQINQTVQDAYNAKSDAAVVEKKLESLRAASNQRFDKLELTLANMTVQLDDLKTIATEPRAPQASA